MRDSLSLKSTLSNLPVYHMSLFVMPMKVSKRIEKIQVGFLWDRGSLEKNPYLVRWTIACKERCNGVVKIKGFLVLDRALQAKLTWRFVSKNESLWKWLLLGSMRRRRRVCVPGKLGVVLELDYGRTSGEFGRI